jgi:hypothetical protein
MGITPLLSRFIVTTITGIYIPSFLAAFFHQAIPLFRLLREFLVIPSFFATIWPSGYPPSELLFLTVLVIPSCNWDNHAVTSCARDISGPGKVGGGPGARIRTYRAIFSSEARSFWPGSPDIWTQKHTLAGAGVRTQVGGAGRRSDP